MSRIASLFAVALLGAGVTIADAAPRTKRASSKDRRPTRSTRANMPRGFVWPPSPHMVALGETCERELDELGVAYEPAKRKGRMLTPVTLASGEIGGITLTPIYAKHQVFDCQLVLALARFAPRLHELGVREIRFGSAFRNTKVRVAGRTKNVLSRHALGIALDIYAVVDDEGREAIVKRHYKRGDELLLAIERAVNDSGMFRHLLTPRNDPRSHHDHFHLEANPDYRGARDAPRPAS